MLERQIAATDRWIAKSVHQLYGLTDAEIELVENRFRSPKGLGEPLCGDETRRRLQP